MKAVINFGRMNPPTIGHLKLANKMSSIPADAHLIYLSHSYDGVHSSKPGKKAIKNPLSYEDKINLAKDTFSQTNVEVVDSPAKTIFQALHELTGQFDGVVLVAGADREEEFVHIMQYNSQDVPLEANYFSFDDISFECAGARDPDSDDAAEQASASLVRKLASNGDYEGFKRFTHYGNPKAAYDLLRSELGLLNESFIRLTEDTHSLHFEDSIVKGPAYMRRMFTFAEHVLNTLSGSQDDLPPMTLKIDGAPAITMFTSIPGISDKPGISTKSLFNATPKFYTSDEEIDADSRGEGLKAKLHTALDLARCEIIPPGEVWQGDMLFAKGDIRHGDKFIYFKPNTLVYAVDENTELANKLLSAFIGIAFHTVYRPGNGNFSIGDKRFIQTNDAAVENLSNIPEDAYVVDARIPNLTGRVSFTATETTELQNALVDLKNVCNALLQEPAYDELCSNDEFIEMYFMTLQNHQVDEGRAIRAETFISELSDWIDVKMDKEYAGIAKLKTEKGRENKRIKLDTKKAGLHSTVDSYQNVIYKMAEALELATVIKAAFIDKLNAANLWMNKVETTSGFENTNGEGFMVSDMDGNFVKLVDRSAFSYFNRSPNVIKGFDDRRV